MDSRSMAYTNEYGGRQEDWKQQNLAEMIPNLKGCLHVQMNIGT